MDLPLATSVGGIKGSQWFIVLELVQWRLRAWRSIGVRDTARGEVKLPSKILNGHSLSNFGIGLFLLNNGNSLLASVLLVSSNKVGCYGLFKPKK